MSASNRRAALPISVVILALNEERNLPACLGSVADWVSAVFVVDAGSTDRTRAIAHEFGATLVEHPFETHAAQWTWALDHLPIETDWVLGLDADQQIGPSLADEICALTPGEVENVDGFYLNRQQWFQGRWIRHGGYYPKYLLKMFRRGRVVMDRRDLVDHHFYVAGPTRTLRHDLIESNRKEDDLTFWIEKHARYAKLLAREEYLWRMSPGGPGEPVVPASRDRTPDERVLARRRFWRRLPLFLRPFLYFGYRYVVRLGFLDGRQGAIFHFMQGFWFRLLVDIHLDELMRDSHPLEHPRTERVSR